MNNRHQMAMHKHIIAKNVEKNYKHCSFNLQPGQVEKKSTYSKLCNGPFWTGFKFLHKIVCMYFVISISAYSYDNVVKSFFEVEFRLTYVFTGYLWKFYILLIGPKNQFRNFHHFSQNLLFLSRLWKSYCISVTFMLKSTWSGRINNKVHEKIIRIRSFGIWKWIP